MNNKTFLRIVWTGYDVEFRMTEYVNGGLDEAGSMTARVALTPAAVKTGGPKALEYILRELDRTLDRGRRREDDKVVLRFPKSFSGAEWIGRTLVIKMDGRGEIVFPETAITFDQTATDLYVKCSSWYAYEKGVERYITGVKHCLGAYGG